MTIENMVMAKPGIPSEEPRRRKIPLITSPVPERKPVPHEPVKPNIEPRVPVSVRR